MVVVPVCNLAASAAVATGAKASVTTEWGRQGHTFVKAGPTVYSSDPTTAVLSKEYLDAAAAAGVYVLVDMAVDGLALAMAGQPKKNHGGGDTNRNLTDFKRWVIGNITHYKDHPAVGGCVHTLHAHCMNMITIPRTAMPLLCCAEETLSRDQQPFVFSFLFWVSVMVPLNAPAPEEQEGEIGEMD